MIHIRLDLHDLQVDIGEKVTVGLLKEDEHTGFNFEAIFPMLHMLHPSAPLQDTWGSSGARTATESRTRGA